LFSVKSDRSVAEESLSLLQYIGLCV
jgi:hypothetical protein